MLNTHSSTYRVIRSILRIALMSIMLTTMSLMCATVQAQQVKVATGAPSGTYSVAFKELQAQCGDVLPMVEINTTGSQQNVDLLTSNKINGAWVQSDVLFYRARTEDLGSIKTLFSLFPEEVHVVALSKPKTEGGFMGVGATAVALNTVNDLKNRKVGAAGGSFITAQVIRLQSEIPFQSLSYPDNNAVIKALVAGQIDAGLFVAGQPTPLIEALNAGFKLLSFPEDVAGKLKGVYRPARVTYSNMGASGVQVVATDSLFVTREYKSTRMLDALAKMRACFVNRLDDLKDTTGTHRAWQVVDSKNKGKWAFYELPTVVAGRK